jgi:pimeloyl-ACP methyl ester carboxylesterase
MALIFNSMCVARDEDDEGPTMNTREPRRLRRLTWLAAAASAIALGGCSTTGNGSRTTTTSAQGSSTTIARGQAKGAAIMPAVADDVNATGEPSFYTPPSPLPAEPPGTLIRAERVTGVPGVPPADAVWRILYHSRTIYQADIAVSGYAVVPSGTAPSGGFPVIAWAHGTSGFARPCAPSLFSNEDSTGVYLMPDLTDYLSAGFAVAATDYQGLGAPGPAPYLLGLSAGQDVLDAAKAALQIPGAHLSHTVIIYGHSQGGHAALFAGQLAPSYAPSLHVIGTVAAAPATGLSLIMSVGFNPKSGNGILAYSLPTAWSWTQTYKDLPASDIFTALGLRVSAQVVTGGCQSYEDQQLSSQHLTVANLFLPSAAKNAVVVAHAKLNDPGRVKTAAPLLVVQGTADTTVPMVLTDAYVSSFACPDADTIAYYHVTGATHGTVVFQAEPLILSWMEARLKGEKAPSTCGDPSHVLAYVPSS